MVLERAVHQPLAHQHSDSEDGAQLEGQALPIPHLAKENVIVELGELGGKLPQLVPARCLFYHDHYLPFIDLKWISSLRKNTELMIYLTGILFFSNQAATSSGIPVPPE